MVTANNGRVSAVRTNLGLFFLDIGSSETLEINGLGRRRHVDVGSGLGGADQGRHPGGDGNDTANIRNDSAETSTAARARTPPWPTPRTRLTEVETVDIPDGQAAPGAPAVPAAPAAPAAPALDTTAPAALSPPRRSRSARGVVAIRVELPGGRDPLRRDAAHRPQGRDVGRVSGRARRRPEPDLQGEAEPRRARGATSAAGPARAVRVTVRDAAGNAGCAPRL